MNPQGVELYCPKCGHLCPPGASHRPCEKCGYGADENGDCLMSK